MPIKRFISSVLSLAFGGAVSSVKFHLLAINYFKAKNRRRLARLFANRLQRKHGVFISTKATVPSSVSFPHPIGVVIGEGVEIGERAVIYQNVTLGGARRGDSQANNYPTIGSDTVIFAGSVVVGKVKVGNFAVIGANAVVTRDVPDYATAAGVPARIVKQGLQ